MSDEMTLYLSGPMTGIPDHNFPLFNAVAHKLRAANAIVYNPAEHFSGRTDLPRAEYMAEDFRKLLEVANADTPVKGIVLLPGWTGSKGARAEVVVAHELGLQFFAWQDERLQRTTLAETFTDTNVPETATPKLAGGEVRVTDPRTGGQKGSKPAAFDLLPWGALAEVAKLYRYGADKYQQAHNWRLGYKWSLSFAAMMRHAAAFWEGEDTDPESKCPHLTSVVFHALAMITYGKESLGTDDRPSAVLAGLREEKETMRKPDGGRTSPPS